MAELEKILFRLKEHLGETAYSQALKSFEGLNEVDIIPIALMMMGKTSLDVSNDCKNDPDVNTLEGRRERNKQEMPNVQLHMYKRRAEKMKQSVARKVGHG